MLATSSNGTSGPQTAMPGARSALILLLAINLFNYIDRQVLAAVLPKIKGAFLADDPDANTKLGALTMVFMVSYMLLAPFFGWLGDRMSRWLLVGVGVVLWSLASGASGLAATFTVLLITRCFVGVGEAAYGPVAPTVISDLYPVKIRGSVLAWFYVAIPVGGALGYLLGGIIADSGLGWRWAFYVVVPPGILLGVLCLWMREPPRGQADAAVSQRKTRWRDYLTLAETPSYVFNTLGMTAMTFAVGGIAAWMPTYIYEREARFNLTDTVLEKLEKGAGSVPASLQETVPANVLVKVRDLRNQEIHPVRAFREKLKERLTPEERVKYEERILDESGSPGLGQINFLFGLIVVVSGLAATLLGGQAGDRLRGRFPGSYFLVSGASMLFAFPMIMLVLYTPFPLAWGFMFLGVFCLFFNTGPTNTILANVTHPAIRSSAFAINILIIHALGDVISPLIMGYIADNLREANGDKYAWDVALTVVSLVVLVGGVLWLLGSRYLARDTALAPTRLNETVDNQ